MPSPSKNNKQFTFNNTDIILPYQHQISMKTTDRIFNKLKHDDVIKIMS